MEKAHRKVAREKATVGVYQHLLIDHTLDEIINYLKHEEGVAQDEETLEFATWLVETTLQNKESYIQLINKYLKKGWTFDRLSVMERAILLIATCELLESDLAKNIVVNEAVVNAKTFCDEQSYKFINGVLSKI